MWVDPINLWKLTVKMCYLLELQSFWPGMNSWPKELPDEDATKGYVNGVGWGGVLPGGQSKVFFQTSNTTNNNKKLNKIVRNSHLKVQENDEKACNNLETCIQEYLLHLSGPVAKKPPTMQRLRFNPWVRNIPWRSKWKPTPAFLPGKYHGQRRLAVHEVAKKQT